MAATTSSINNIEKLIQMATLEQMYNLLNKLREKTPEDTTSALAKANAIDLDAKFAKLKHLWIKLFLKLHSYEPLLRLKFLA